jgi:8-oxo-dGTP diphosphatase
LLLKGSETKTLWAGKYNGIGGHVERGEDIFSAAYRELIEETGITDINLRLCGLTTIDISIEIGVGIYIFKGDCSYQPQLTSEDGILEWISKDEIYQKPLVEDLYTMLPLILRNKPSDALISAQYSYDDDERLRITLFHT